MLSNVLVSAIEHEQLPHAIAGLIAIVLLLRIPPEDLASLMYIVIDGLERGALIGYVLFIVTATGWYRAARRLKEKEE